MHFRLPVRRLLAATVALLACAFAASPSMSSAAEGTYTQILCANPDTGVGVVASTGRFPDGVTQTRADNPFMAGMDRWAQCAGSASATSGFIVSTATAFTTHIRDAGAALRYLAPDDVSFRGAVLYRHTTMIGGSNWLGTIHGERGDFMYGLPRWDICSQHGGCVVSGSTVDRFGNANRVTVGQSAGLNGFWLVMKCNTPGDNTWACVSDGRQTLRIYGGKITLADASHPAGAEPTGQLTEDGVLRGSEELTVNATDTGSGLYRVRMLVDGALRRSEVVDDNEGRCVDVNPGNEDPYEFASGRPCKLSTGATYDFDTTGLSDGPANVKVVIEDAAGNATTLLNRSFTVDNIPAPSNVGEPAITGTLRRTHRLSGDAGEWNDHGAAGDPSVALQWQRCDRSGAGCVDIVGAGDDDYTLADDDIGRRVRVVAIASNSEGVAQAASGVSAIVTREDGTLPEDRDGIDNDGDGTVDETGEQTPAPQPTGPGGPDDIEHASGATNTRLPTASGAQQQASSSGHQVNGEGASRRARLSVAFEGMSVRRLSRRYGKSAAVVGTLTDEHGRPIRGAVVEVSSVAAVRGAAPVAGKALVTGPDGGFRYKASARTASRMLRFAYRYENPGEIVAGDSLELHVKAAVKLAVRLQGAVVRYSGRVLSGPIPATGKLVILQGRVKGAGWQTFATRRARGRGTFRGRYRLKVRRPGTRLQFRARVLTEAGYPYLSTTGRAVTRTVR